jgi:uncharacterized protein (TIGR02099 family)
LSTLSSSLLALWRGLHFTSRVLVVLAALTVVLAGSAFLAVRHWLLPNADHLRAYVVEVAESRIGQRIGVGRLEVNWAGLRPDLTLREVRVFDRRGFPVLTFDSVHAVLSWRSLAALELRARVLAIDGPHVHIARDTDGRFYVAGIPLPDSPQEGAGEAQFADWLLRQRVVMVRGARITWEDEFRAAPPLTLENVELRLENAGPRHRAALRGAAPGALGGTLDLRADLTADGIGQWRRASGEIFAALDSVALEAWRAWLELPLELTRGRGAVRAWLTLAEGRPTAATVDANLAGVSLRLAPGLPTLSVVEAAGRVRWREGEAGREIGGQGLRVVTDDGIRVGPADLSLELRTGADGRTGAVAFSANRVDLASFAALAGHLPINEETRARLAALAPRGVVTDVVAAWEGELPAPAGYRMRARFDGLELKAQGVVPGLSGVSGYWDGNEKHGRFSIDGRRAELTMPKVFAAPLRFDSLAIRGAWNLAGDGTQVTLEKAVFDNADLAGSVTGTYMTAPSGPGTVNLTGALSRADARTAHRYLPLEVSADARDWVRTSVLAGRATNTQFALRGDLAKFPFPDERDGLFEVTTRAEGVDLSYADDWPPLKGVSADLQFRGPALRITSGAGTILGVPVSGVTATIPDLDADDPVLDVAGGAEGETAAFLRFIAQTPVDRHIGGFTREVTAAGAGRLALRLRVPLERTRDTTVEGRFSLLANRLVLDDALPPLEDVSGELRFTDEDLKSEGVRGRLMGGPFTLSARTEAGALRIDASGRLDLDAYAGRDRYAWLRRAAGAADWSYTQRARRERTDETLKSSLQGLALLLPPPLAKPSSATLPFSVERSRHGARETLSLRLGNVVSAQASGRVNEDGGRVERAAVVLGGGDAQAHRPGLWVSGNAAALDLDAWRDLLDKGGGDAGPALQGIDLTVGRLFAFDRPFRDLHVEGQLLDGVLRARLDGRELAGDVSWDARGEGVLRARLGRLVIPSDQTLGRSAEPSRPEARSLPGLDVVAEQFALGERSMGRLELYARNDAGRWRVEKLELRHPDSVISADGEWSARGTPPTSAFNLRLEAIDLGRFAARIGVGEGMRGGGGSASGRIQWAGSPYRIDFPTLGGALRLDFRDGEFDEVDPGMARLLGVLSLSALPRRLGGDFNDVLGKGFSFQQIAGDVRLERGVARTENLRLVSPSVRVAMSGEVDLARENQDLLLRVSPELSETAALATGVLGGPVVGLATLAVAKLFRDPIGRLTALEYNVTGSWSDPKVTKRSKEPLQEPPQ